MLSLCYVLSPSVHRLGRHFRILPTSEVNRTNCMKPRFPGAGIHIPDGTCNKLDLCVQVREICFKPPGSILAWCCWVCFMYFPDCIDHTFPSACRGSHSSQQAADLCHKRASLSRTHQPLNVHPLTDTPTGWDQTTGLVSTSCSFHLSLEDGSL